MQVTYTALTLCRRARRWARRYPRAQYPTHMHRYMLHLQHVVAGCPTRHALVNQLRAYYGMWQLWQWAHLTQKAPPCK